MAPAPRGPAGGGGLGKRLTRKVGPLPVWAWAAIVLGLYLLWSRTRGAAATAATDATPAPADVAATDSGAQVPASGQGSAADNFSSQAIDMLNANTSSLDALTSQLLSMPSPYSNFGDAPAAGAPVDSTAPGTSTPTATTTPHPAALGAPPAAHPTQTAAGSLSWGGLTFTTKAAFDRWARAHGSTATKELSNHPQARAIYSTLR